METWIRLQFDTDVPGSEHLESYCWIDMRGLTYLHWHQAFCGASLMLVLHSGILIWESPNCTASKYMNEPPGLWQYLHGAKKRTLPSPLYWQEVYVGGGVKHILAGPHLEWHLKGPRLAIDLIFFFCYSSSSGTTALLVINYNNQEYYYFQVTNARSSVCNLSELYCASRQKQVTGSQQKQDDERVILTWS